MAAAHTLPRELRAQGYVFDARRFKNLRNPTLLLLGGDSPDFAKAAIEAVDAALPNSRIAVLPGQQHIAVITPPAKAGSFAQRAPEAIPLEQRLLAQRLHIHVANDAFLLRSRATARSEPLCCTND